jgi:AraC-like DNA-binding protein
MSLLSESLRAQLIPWSKLNAEERFIVARSKMSAAQMPDGVILKRRAIVGPRVIVKNRREYRNARNQTAKWPEAQMDEWTQYKMVCVLAGGINFHVSNYAVQCGEGFYLLLPPGIPQTNAPYHASGIFCDVLNIVLYSHALQCFISHAQPGQKQVHHSENYLFKSPRLVEIFRMLTEELTEGQKHARRIGGNLLEIFWLVLQREVETERYTHPGPHGRPGAVQINNDTASDFKTELLQYVQMHLSQNLTLEKVSRGMYLSRTQFVRKMHQETGKSFVKYLTEYRIGEAKVLLQDSDWTVSAIASFLGFGSSTYFQAVFRRVTGKTPSEYRNTEKMG